MSAPAKQGFYVVAALLALYVIGGSTYYAMRVALDFLPPFLMAGSRFLAAGLVLVVAMLSRCPASTWSQWLGAGPSCSARSSDSARMDICCARHDPQLRQAMLTSIPSLPS